MRILYKLPCRLRSKKLIETIQNVIDLAEHEDYVILVSLDYDDVACNTPEVRAQLAMFQKVIVCFGNGTGSKVEAINRDVEKIEQWDIMFVISDDMKFVVKGFDRIVIDLFRIYFKNRMGVLHTWDGITNEKQITLAIFNREWYDHFGYIYNPIYVSVYCDTEMKAVAETIGAYHMEPIILNRHLHAAWGLAENDDLYKRNEEPKLYARDCEMYNARRNNNFGIPISY